jgi:uncharacterized protein
MELLGLILGILIGITLGLIGSGGSILTIPIFVYIIGISPLLATTYSLFVVGAAAAVGSVVNAKQGAINTTAVLYFGIPSVIAIFLMRRFVMPIIPQQLFNFYGTTITLNFLIMLVFAVLLFWASFAMIRNANATPSTTLQITPQQFIFKGIVIGVLTGFVGVGGGFLIIPTLVFTARMAMRNAIATSLVIIACNASIGFLGSLKTMDTNWQFLLLFTAFAVVGIFIGIYLSKRITSNKLKPVFGWFILATGVYILAKELFFKN